MNKDIGIGILDLYDEECLQNCWDSIPEEYKSQDDLLNCVFIARNNNNRSILGQTKTYSSPVQLAAMKNYLISQMRLKGCKYYFILHSNQVIKNPNIFEDTIKLAETFGTWLIFGPSTDSIPLEDDENQVTLNLSKNLNTEFMFIFSGIIKTFGYFEERFYNTLKLDAIDYLLKLRNKKAYPPTDFHPTIPNDWVESSIGVFNKMGHKDMPDTDQSVQLSYALFFNNNKYIPTQNDPKEVSNDVLLATMEEIQKNYAKPRK